MMRRGSFGRSVVFTLKMVGNTKITLLKCDFSLIVWMVFALEERTHILDVEIEMAAERKEQKKRSAFFYLSLNTEIHRIRFSHVHIH